MVAFVAQNCPYRPREIVRVKLEERWFDAFFIGCSQCMGEAPSPYDRFVFQVFGTKRPGMTLYELDRESLPQFVQKVAEIDK